MRLVIAGEDADNVERVRVLEFLAFEMRQFAAENEVEKLL